MSSTPESIESYIHQTISAEAQAAEDAVREHQQKIQDERAQLRSGLEAALEADDRKTAIRIAWQLLEADPEDDRLDSLYHFLLARVGVERREPLFSFSTQPAVATLSAVLTLYPVWLLIAHLLTPANAAEPSTTDPLTCVGAALFFGIPLIDHAFAATFNYVNRHRLRE
ncbi:MAG: hypothetical protein R3C49_08175 [Planctomycetaceae bacterium]